MYQKRSGRFTAQLAGYDNSYLVPIEGGEYVVTVLPVDCFCVCMLLAENDANLIHGGGWPDARP